MSGTNHERFAYLAIKLPGVIFPVSTGRRVPTLLFERDMPLAQFELSLRALGLKRRYEMFDHDYGPNRDAIFHISHDPNFIAHRVMIGGLRSHGGDFEMDG
ncbi:hypothetical protein N7501_004781 [Penicillium viridicatum]|nr:hypothetical protein N7501_004781 [Penicillium viridicatum]